MPYGKVFRAEEVRSLAAAGVLAGTWTAVGTAFDNPVRAILVQNFTDQSVMFSFNNFDAAFDGHFPLLSEGYIIIDVSANQPINDPWFIREGTTMYVRRLGAGVPATGDVYVSAFYGQGD